MSHPAACTKGCACLPGGPFVCDPVPATPAPTRPEPGVPMLECDECAEVRSTLSGVLGEIHDCPQRGAFRLVHYVCKCASCRATRAHVYCATCCPDKLTHGVNCICGVTIRANAAAPVPEDREEATPWPARDVVAELVARAEHLLSHHNCDCHGYELTDQALLVAKAWLAAHGHTEGPNGR